jgi:type IV secretion system protein VirB4
VTEWRAVEASEAVHYIESMRTHFHKTKSSLSVSSGGDRLKDETKAEFVDDLNECLKEVQKRGNYFGKFSLTIVVYDRDRAKVEKAVSDFAKAFSNVGATLHSETYNQLSAFFATCPKFDLQFPPALSPTTTMPISHSCLRSMGPPLEHLS